MNLDLANVVGHGAICTKLQVACQCRLRAKKYKLTNQSEQRVCACALGSTSAYHEAIAEAHFLQIMSGGLEAPWLSAHWNSVNSGVTISRPVFTSGMIPARIQPGNMAGGPSTHPQPGAQNVAAALQACLTGIYYNRPTLSYSYRDEPLT